MGKEVSTPRKQVLDIEDGEAKRVDPEEESDDEEDGPDHAGPGPSDGRAENSDADDLTSTGGDE